MRSTKKNEKNRDQFLIFKNFLRVHDKLVIEI